MYYKYIKSYWHTNCYKCIIMTILCKKPCKYFGTSEREKVCIKKFQKKEEVVLKESGR